MPHNFLLISITIGFLPLPSNVATWHINIYFKTVSNWIVNYEKNKIKMWIMISVWEKHNKNKVSKQYKKIHLDDKSISFNGPVLAALFINHANFIINAENSSICSPSAVLQNPRWSIASIRHLTLSDSMLSMIIQLKSCPVIIQRPIW